MNIAHGTPGQFAWIVQAEEQKAQRARNCDNEAHPGGSRNRLVNAPAADHHRDNEGGTPTDPKERGKSTERAGEGCQP